MRKGGREERGRVRGRGSELKQCCVVPSPVPKVTMARSTPVQAVTTDDESYDLSNDGMMSSINVRKLECFYDVKIFSCGVHVLEKMSYLHLD